MEKAQSVCAALGVTEQQVDHVDRIEGPAGSFYQVTDPASLEVTEVHLQATGTLLCACGTPGCEHHRVAQAAHLLFQQESVERARIERLVAQDYTRQSAEAHVYRGAPLVLRYQAPPCPIDPAWEREQRQAAAREERARKRDGERCYQPKGFSLWR